MILRLKTVCFMNKHRILITGGAGSIGSALAQRLLDQGHTVCIFDNDENGLFEIERKFSHHLHKRNLRIFLGDIRDQDRLERSLENVDCLFHCAALKHVYLSEFNPFDVIQTNILGVQNIIICAIKQKVKKIIFTSSDKAVNPSSTMGASKLLGERLFLAASSQTGTKNTKFCCVRFGNVINSKGSVLKIFQSQLDSNLPLTITSERMTRYFITMKEAEDLCMFASENMIGGEIFISNMGATNILSLAKAFCKERVFKYKLIGEKAGEKYYEELMTELELVRTVRFKNRYVILPDIPDNFDSELKIMLNKKYGKSSKVKKLMRSDLDLLGSEKLSNLIKGLTGA